MARYKATITDRDYNQLANQTARTVRDAISRANREAETTADEFVRVTVCEKQLDGSYRHLLDAGHFGKAEAVAKARTIAKNRGLR